MTLTSSDGAVIALVAHARDVAATERAAFGARIRALIPPGGLVLQTCHRVEAYLVRSEIAAQRDIDARLPRGGAVLVGEEAVRHAVAVAVGRDSVVLGEDQVLHQLREAVDASRRSGDLDTVIDRLLTVALGAGRRARSWHQGPRLSLADIAVQAMADRTGDLRDRRVLVVGAGTMGRLGARAARGAGADLAIASRSAAHAGELAANTAGRVEAFDPGTAAGTYAGIIVALAGPWSLGAEARDALARSSTVVVDLSQPPAVPREVADALAPRLVTADELAGLGRGSSEAAAPRARDRVDDLVDRTVSDFLAWLAARPGRDAAALLVDRAEREREAELAELWRRHPGFGPEARVAIESMTRHLAQRILRQPLERLGRDDDGHGADAARDLFAL